MTPTRAAALSGLRRIARRTSLVLAYHGVGATTSADDPHFLRVDQGAFRHQLELLLEAGFEIVTVADLASRIDGGAPPRGVAALSFDDGMDDNHSVVMPLLREYGVPATVYVTTGLIGMPNPWLDAGLESRMMTEDELRELADAGFELGAHTVTHPDLAQLDYDACLAEMTASRDEVARITGQAVRTFAYPFCTYGEAAVAAARAAGFEAAVTCVNRGGWDRYELARHMITGKDGLSSFALKLAGAYYPLFDSGPGRVVRGSTRALRRHTRSLLER